MLLPMLVSCGQDDAGVSSGGSSGDLSDPASVSGTVRLYSYEDGFNEDYLASFHEMYPNITLDTAAFGSNEEMIAKVQAGFEADVINSCVDEATLEAVEKGVYAPLDTSRLQDWDNIWPAMKEMPGVIVDDKVYLVPVDAGGAGIIYNADEVTTPPDSWADIFDPQWAGKSALEDNAVTAINVGALASGVTRDPLSIDADQLEQVQTYLTENLGNLRTLWNGGDDLRAKFKSGEIIIASGYPGSAKELADDGLNIKFAAAKEGQMLWTCGYGISPDIDDENVDAAYALLNWYTSIPAQVYAATNWNYLTSNEGIVDAVTPEVREAAALDSLYTLDNAIPASPPENREDWVRAWTEVKGS